jgi:hypothetical protein
VKRALLLLASLSAAGAGALAAGACGERVKDVTVAIEDDDAGPHGFLCVDDAGVPLAARVLDEDAGMAVVVDFFDFGASVVCKPFDLLQWCNTRDGGCPLLLPYRKCIPLEPVLDAGEGLNGHERLIAQARATLHQLADEHAEISGDAPDQVVMVRVTVLAEGCAAATASPAFDCNKLMGCATSCPELLSATEGEITVSLPTAGTHCTEADVVMCAHQDLTNLDPICEP